MRRIIGIATLNRALASGNTTASKHLLVQAAMMSSNSISKPQNFPYGITDRFALPTPSVTRGFAGNMLVFDKPKDAGTTLVFDKPKDVVLYQYEACPFCNKVKAFLDYYNIPYEVVEVNPINKEEIKWSDYKKVPILTVDGENMVDSSDIINKLYRRIYPDKSIPEDDEEKMWLGWVDNYLVHVSSPNICFSASEALKSFDDIITHGNFGFTGRLVAVCARVAVKYFVRNKLKKKHNITNERAALYSAAEKWVVALKGREFLGGSKPNLADLAVFGVLRPIRYLKSGKDMVKYTRIGDWYSRMENAVGQATRVKT